MKKILISLVVVILIAVGIYFYTQNKDVVINSEDAKSQLEKIKEQNFGDMAKFFKDNLSKEQIEKIKEILKNKNISLEEAKNKLSEAFNNSDGDMNAAYEYLANVLNKTKGDLLPYFKEDKKQDVEEYFRKIGSEIEDEFVGK